jgi:Phage integrase, N-terminal SAM-like domain
MVKTHPAELTGAEAKRFLADLAVRRQVSAAAQNQAFNALLFLFRHVFTKELGDFSDTPRAKRSKYRYWWRIQKYARVTFGKCLKTAVVSLIAPKKMNSPPVSVYPQRAFAAGGGIAFG